jgi:hypothetical protein
MRSLLLAESLDLRPSNQCKNKNGSNRTVQEVKKACNYYFKLCNPFQNQNKKYAAHNVVETSDNDEGTED